MIDNNVLVKITNLLKQKNLTVATAESCSGGLIAHNLTNISGSSDFFDRGIVSYSNNAKMELLGVSEETLNKYGAVSEQVAYIMAENIRTMSNVDIGISTTGIAGPTGGTKEKPIGLVYIAVSTTKKVVVKKFQFTGNRLQNKENTCNSSLQMLLDTLNKY